MSEGRSFPWRRLLIGGCVVVAVIVLAGVLFRRVLYDLGGPEWSPESAGQTSSEMIGVRADTLEVLGSIDGISVPDDDLPRPSFSPVCGATGDHALLDLDVDLDVVGASNEMLDATSGEVAEYWQDRGFDLVLQRESLSDRPQLWSLERGNLTLTLFPEGDEFRFGIESECRHSPGWEKLALKV